MLCVYIIILKENVVLLKFLRIANISMIEQCSEISGGGGGGYERREIGVMERKEGRPTKHVGGKRNPCFPVSRIRL